MACVSSKNPGGRSYAWSKPRVASASKNDLSSVSCDDFEGKMCSILEESDDVYRLLSGIDKMYSRPVSVRMA